MSVIANKRGLSSMQFYKTAMDLSRDITKGVGLLNQAVCLIYLGPDGSGRTLLALPGILCCFKFNAHSSYATIL